MPLGVSADSTTGSMADMSASIASYHVRAGLRSVMSPYAFDDNGISRAGLCPLSATPCGKDVKSFLPDAGVSCCPSDYLCFMPHSTSEGSGALSELDTPLCGQRQGAGSSQLRLTNAQISQCMLLLGLLDTVPRDFLPDARTTVPPSGNPIPPAARRSAAGLQRQAALLEQYPVMYDFFLYKLVDGWGLMSFVGVSAIIIITFINFVTSLLPSASSHPFYRLPTSSIPGLATDASADHVNFTLTCSSLMGLSSPFSTLAGPVPTHAYRHFSSFRLSCVCMVLLLPVGWTLFSGHFDLGGFYERLVVNQCFSVTDDVSNLFVERLRCFASMKTSVIALWLTLTARIIVFYTASRYHHMLSMDRVMDPTAMAINSMADDDDDLDEVVGGTRRNHRTAEPYPGFKSRYDSDYESDVDDAQQEDLKRKHLGNPGPVVRQFQGGIRSAITLTNGDTGRVVREAMPTAADPMVSGKLTGSGRLYNSKAITSTLVPCPASSAMTAAMFRDTDGPTDLLDLDDFDVDVTTFSHPAGSIGVRSTTTSSRRSSQEISEDCDNVMVTDIAIDFTASRPSTSTVSSQNAVGSRALGVHALQLGRLVAPHSTLPRK